MYVYIYVCMYIYMSICMYVYTYGCMYMYVYPYLISLLSRHVNGPQRSVSLRHFSRQSGRTGAGIY